MVHLANENHIVIHIEGGRFFDLLNSVVTRSVCESINESTSAHSIMFGTQGHVILFVFGCPKT